MWIPRLFRTTGLSIGLNGRREKKNWNINPFNKLIIDEIYRTFTVRVGGANVLLLSRRNPGNISGLAPLRLDLRARTNEPGSALNAKRWCISVHQLSIGRQCSGRTMRHDQRYRRKFIPRPSTFRPSKIPTIHSRIINNVLASAKYDQRHSIRSSYTRLSLKCDSSHATFLRCYNIGANALETPHSAWMHRGGIKASRNVESDNMPNGLKTRNGPASPAPEGWLDRIWL